MVNGVSILFGLFFFFTLEGFLSAKLVDRGGKGTGGGCGYAEYVSIVVVVLHKSRREDRF